MKTIKVAICMMLLASLALLASCQNIAAGPAEMKPLLEMEMDENYSNADPFVNARLFHVAEKIDTLDLQISVQMEGESGVLEIADRNSDKVFWSESWTGTLEKTQYEVTILKLDPDKEYVVQFTGTKIKDAKIQVYCDNSLVSEQTRPKAN